MAFNFSDEAVKQAQENLKTKPISDPGVDSLADPIKPQVSQSTTQLNFSPESIQAAKTQVKVEEPKKYYSDELETEKAGLKDYAVQVGSKLLEPLSYGLNAIKNRPEMIGEVMDNFNPFTRLEKKLKYAIAGAMGVDEELMDSLPNQTVMDAIGRPLKYGLKGFKELEDSNAIAKIKLEQHKMINRLPQNKVKEIFYAMNTFTEGDEFLDYLYPNRDEVDAKIATDTNLFAPKHSIARTLANGLTTHLPRMAARYIPLVGNVAMLGFYEMEMEETEGLLRGWSAKNKVDYTDKELANYIMIGGGISGALEDLQYTTGLKQVANTLTTKQLRTQVAKFAFGTAGRRIGVFLGSQAFATLTEGIEEFGQEEVKLLTLNAYIHNKNQERAERGEAPLDYISFKEMREKGWKAFQEGTSMGLIFAGPGTVTGVTKEIQLNTIKGQRKAAQKKRKKLFANQERVDFVYNELEPELDAQVDSERRQVLEEQEEADLWRKWREIQEAILPERAIKFDDIEGGGIENTTEIELLLEEQEGASTKEKLINGILENTRKDDAWITRKQALLYEKLEGDDRLGAADKFFLELLIAQETNEAADQIDLDRALVLKQVMEAMVTSIQDNRGKPKFLSLDNFIETWISEGQEAEKRLTFLQGEQKKYEPGSAAHSLFDVFKSREEFKKYRHDINAIFSINDKDATNAGQVAKKVMYQAASNVRQSLLKDMQKQGVKVNKRTIGLFHDIIKDAKDIDDPLIDYLFEDDKIYDLLEKAGGELNLEEDMEFTHEQTELMNAFLELSNNFLYAYMSPKTLQDKRIASLSGDVIRAVYGEDVLSVADFANNNLPYVTTQGTVKGYLHEIIEDYRLREEIETDPKKKKELQDRINYYTKRFEQAPGPDLTFEQAQRNDSLPEGEKVTDPVLAEELKQLGLVVDGKQDVGGGEFVYMVSTPDRIITFMYDPKDNLKEIFNKQLDVNPKYKAKREAKEKENVEFVNDFKQEDMVLENYRHNATHSDFSVFVHEGQTFREALIKHLEGFIESPPSDLTAENRAAIEAELAELRGEPLSESDVLKFNQELDERMLEKLKAAAKRKGGQKKLPVFRDKFKNPYKRGTLAYDLVEATFAREFMRMIKFGKVKVEDLDSEEGARYWDHVKDIKVRPYTPLGESAGEVAEHEYGHAVQSKLEAKIYQTMISRKLKGKDLLRLIEASKEYYAGDASGHWARQVNDMIAHLKKHKNDVIDPDWFAPSLQSTRITPFFLLDRYLGELMSMYSAGHYNSVNKDHKKGSPERKKLTEIADSEVGDVLETILGEEVLGALTKIQKEFRVRTWITPQFEKAIDTLNKSLSNRSKTGYNDVLNKIVAKYGIDLDKKSAVKYGLESIEDVYSIPEIRELNPSVLKQLTETERDLYDRSLFLAKQRHREARAHMSDAQVKFYQRGRKLDTGSTVVKGQTSFFSDMQAMVQFFRTADISTIAHEFVHVLTPHLSFEQQERLKHGTLVKYYQTGTPAFRSAKKAMDRAIDMFLEDPSDPRLTGGMNHFFLDLYMETIAREFEAYLFEGEAPVASLKPAMKTVAEDMANVYGSLAEIPLVNGQMSPTIRKVFDKMLAGDKFIKHPVAKKIQIEGTDYTIFVDRAANSKINKLLKSLAHGFLEVEGIIDTLWQYAEATLGDVQMYDKNVKKDVKADKAIHDLISNVTSHKEAVEAVATIDKMRLKLEKQYHGAMVTEIQTILKNVDWKKSDKLFILKLKNAIMDIDFNYMDKKTLDELNGIKGWLKDRISKGIVEDEMLEIAIDKLKQLDRLSQKNIYDFTLGELQELRDAVQLIISLEGKKQALRIGRRLSVLETDKAALDAYLDTVPLNEKALQEEQRLKEPYMKLVSLATKTGIQPHRILMIMSQFDKNNPLWKIVKNFRAGESITFARDQRDRDFFRDLLNHINNPETWSQYLNRGELDDSHVSTYELEDNVLGKRTVKITKAQRIALYLYSKNINAKRHLLGGGIVLPGEKKQGRVVKLNNRDLAHIVGSMSPAEIELAEKLEGYYRDQVAPAINEVSRQLVGYDIATEDNYFPIYGMGGDTSNAEVFNTPQLSKNMNTFKNKLIQRMNFLRERTKDSSPIILYDAFEITQMNLKDVNRYVGLALPIQYAKVMFNRTKKGEGTYYDIARRWGTNNADAIMKWIRDIEDPSVSQSALDKYIKRQKRAVVTAQLGYNMSVAIIQRLSFGLAKNYGISWSSLAEATKRNYNISTGFGVTYNHSMDEMAREIPEIAQRFEVGPNIDVEELYNSSATRHMWLQPTSLREDAAKVKNFHDFSNILTRMSTTSAMQWIKENDAHALSTIYDMVLIEGEKQGWSKDEMKDKFLEIVYNTQPNYNTLNLSELLRTKNVLMKILFGTYQTMYNQIYNELYYHGAQFVQEYKKATNKREKANALKDITMKYGLMFIFTNVMVSVLKEAVGGNSDEPEEFAENVGKRIFNGIFLPIPVFGPILAEAAAAITDSRGTYSVFDPPGSFMFAYFESAIRDVDKLMDNMEDGEALAASYNAFRLVTKGLAVTQGYAWETIVAQAERWMKRLDIVD